LVSTQLSQLQDAATSRASNDAFFQYIHVDSLRLLSTGSEIADKMSCIKPKNGKAGATLLMLMPSLGCDAPNLSGPKCEGSFVMRALELPQFNKTGVTAEETAFKCLDLFHGWAPGFLNGGIYATKDAVQPSIEFAPRIAYDVRFKFTLALDQTAKVMVPMITYAAGNVTITCATADAVIRYTNDGTYPSPSSTLYEAPFAADVGTRIIAVAFKDAMSASDGKDTTLS
jgi:hypothetical protein